MRERIVSLGLGCFLLGAFAVPDTAFARETDQAETINCTDPRHRHVVNRPLTESPLIRKTDKIRIRRILMYFEFSLLGAAVLRFQPHPTQRPLLSATLPFLHCHII